MPEQYDEKYKRWNLTDLPIIPQEWKMLVKKESLDPSHPMWMGADPRAMAAAL